MYVLCMKFQFGLNLQLVGYGLDLKMIRRLIFIFQTFQRVEVDKALNDAVTQLNCDVDHMKARLTTLENLVTSMRPTNDNNQ